MVLMKGMEYLSNMLHLFLSPYVSVKCSDIDTYINMSYAFGTAIPSSGRLVMLLVAVHLSPYLNIFVLSKIFYCE